MSEIEIFFKEFIESKGFRKLKSVDKVLLDVMDLSTFSVHSLILFLESSRNFKQFIVGVSATFVDKRGEYILNQQYTINADEVISYYTWYARDNKLQNILE